MDICYNKPVKVHYELDLDALVSIIVKDFEEKLDDSIIYNSIDKKLFLERVGFKDWDYLDTHKIGLIYDAVCDKLEQLYN